MPGPGGSMTTRTETPGRATAGLEPGEDLDAVACWDDAHRYTPAPRHRRRLLIRQMSQVHFDDVLDAGCAQPFLLKEVAAKFKARGYGCDLSERVVAENRKV